MNAITKLSCLLLAVVTLSSCSHPSSEVVTEPAPLTAEDLRIAHQAMTPDEVSLLLRGGTRQDAIIAEVTKRHLSAPPDAATEDALLQSKASPALIAAMKAPANILTASQKQEFDNFAANKTQRVQQEASSRQQAALAAQRAEENDRREKAAAIQQAQQNALVAQHKDKATEQAWETHKRQKEYLERRIASLQNDITRRRTAGAKETSLLEANQELDRLNEQLRQLPTPQLR
ncbi:MAG: hypothetical protein QOH88_476 [Verrucomicrobiota bacterium]|jgi:hypothetical protein